MIEEDIVIVIDLSQYKNDYKQKVPFKAKVLDRWDNEIFVKSLNTGRKYELYYNQILEDYSNEDLIKFIDIEKFGEI